MNRILSSFLLLLLAIALLGCPRRAGAQGVAPYIDMSITADENIVSIASASGLKAFTLAFLDADGACDIGWGGLGGALPSDNLADGTSILTVVQQLKAAGVTPIFSIGGADGVDPAAYCTSASSLQAVYQTAVSRYGITYLDFDIEGAATAEPAQITLRDQALVGLKSANPGLVISYTIPVLPTGLVAGDGLNLLTSAKSDGVALSVVNIMTMDYGSSGTEMGSAATEAAAATEAQIKAAGLSSTRGITPMIGQNDTGGEIFTLADATTVVNFAKANSYVSRLAYWSVGRDNGSCAGDTAASPSCSGISQSTYQFAGIFEGFGGSGGSGGGGGTGGGGTTLTSGDTYTFTPQNAPALRLDDSGARTTTGNPIQVYTSNGTGAQNWTGSTSGVVPAGYWNFATEGAFCLTASGTTSGSPAVLDPCIGSSAQAWEAVQSGSFYNFHPADNTALCLDVRQAGTASGTIVQVYTCNGTNAQNWTPTLN
jgi:chitinase